jgi:hypothetical protein
MAKDVKKVRYQVLAPVFIDGSLVEPKGGKDTYVLAEPGLEGRALKLAPGRELATPKDGGGDKGSGDGSGSH